MQKQDILKKLLEDGVVGIIRMNDRRRVHNVIEALCNGGIKVVEITLTVPGALELIHEMRKTVSADILIGAGTVTDGDMARAAIKAGAQFIVSPIFNPQVVGICKEEETVCIPGCSTATEIYNAWTAGADIIKLFPSRQLGPQFLRDISGPFPHIRFMPTSLTIDLVPEWVAAGAVAVGVGKDLLDQDAITEERYEVLTERARRLMASYQAAKKAL